jgi:hypothetical protein
MSSEDNPTHLHALQIVEAHFPDELTRVRRLFHGNETFRSICEDLAAATETLARVDHLPDTIREARRQEYRDLVDALVKELRDGLASSRS